MVEEHRHTGWDSPQIDAGDLLGTLPVAHGGTGLGTTPTNGQLLIGNGSGFTLANLTAGTGVTITNGIGTITIAGSGKWGGTGADGALNLTGSTNTTIDFGSAGIKVKNYSSMNIQDTASLSTIGASDNGGHLIIKCSGDCTITSTAAAAIDLRGGGSDIAGSTNSGANCGVAVTTSANTKVAGNDGKPGYTNLFKTNFGTGASTAVPSVSTGGAVPTFEWHNISYVLMKYPWICPGAGAGSGTAQSDGLGTSLSGRGGRGGGVLILEVAGALNFATGTVISASGQNGADGSGSGDYRSGGGGGGGAGCVLIFYNTLTANAGTITVAGGTGGKNANTLGSSTAAGGGAGGASCVNPGSAGTNNVANGAKDGGDGGAGFSLVAQNTEWS